MILLRNHSEIEHSILDSYHWTIIPTMLSLHIANTEYYIGLVVHTYIKIYIINHLVKTGSSLSSWGYHWAVI